MRMPHPLFLMDVYDMSLLTKTTTADFDGDVLQHDGVVLVDFYADWCGPCKAVEPLLEDLAREYEGELKIVKVDTDAETELKDRFGVRGIPYFLIVKGGEVVQSFAGGRTRGEFAAILEKQMGSF